MSDKLEYTWQQGDHIIHSNKPIISDEYFDLTTRKVTVRSIGLNLVKKAIQARLNNVKQAKMGFDEPMVEQEYQALVSKEQAFNDILADIEEIEKELK